MNMALELCTDSRIIAAMNISLTYIFLSDCPPFPSTIILYEM